MGKLFIVGTPIGNLKDITFRAVETLKQVDIIACEDTRVTMKLLNAYNISGPKLIAHHANNEKLSALGIIKLIQEGKNVALVSDAGMPVINDPGFLVIREAIKNSVQIEVIPGPSATITALVLSNYDSHFTFLGFLKPKTGQRQNQLKALINGTYVCFVSVHQIIETLNDFKNVFGSTFELFVGRELTKMHESQYRGTADDIITKLKEETLGEFTVVFEVNRPKEKNDKKWRL